MFTRDAYCAARSALAVLVPLLLAGCPTTGGRDRTAPTLTVSPSGGAFSAPIEVSLFCDDDRGPCAAIRYTLDGSEPGPASQRYDGLLTIASSLVLSAAGWDAAGNRSRSLRVSFVIDAEPPVAFINPPGGLF